jgi:hypothetical protein
MCCALSPSPAHPLSSLEEEEGEREIPILIIGWQHNPAAIQPSPPTDNGINYDNNITEPKKGGSKLI